MKEESFPPKIGYLSWMDAFTEGRSLIKLSLMLLGCLTLWYIAATSPLILSKQYTLLTHYIWLLGLGGIFLSFFTYAAIKPLINKHFENIDLIVCDNHKANYRNNVNSVISSLANQKLTYAISLGIILLFITSLALTWVLDSPLVIFDFLGVEWFGKTPGQTLRIVSLTIAVTPVMFILVTGLRLMFSLLMVIRVVDSVDFIPSPRICQRKIMPTLKLLLNISFLFSAFAAFFIVLFKDRLWPLTDFSILYWGIILLIIFTGMAGVIYPVFVVRNKMTAMKEKRLDAITEKVINLTQKDDIDSVKTIIELYRLEEQLEFNNQMDSLFISWKYFTSFILSIVIPLAIAVIQIYVQQIITL